MKDEEDTEKKDLIVLLMLVPLRAWLVMLAFGVLHNDWSVKVPGLGFWACLLLSLGFAGVVRK